MAQQKNIADQIGDAVQDALEHQDFSKIQEMVAQGVNVAAKGIGNGISQAAATTRQMYQEYQRSQAERMCIEEQQRELARVAPTRFANIQGSKVGGYVMAILGGLFAVGFAIAALVALAGSFVGPASMLGTASVVMLVLAAASAGVGVAGGMRASFANRFAQYCRTVGTAEAMSVGELAGRTGRPLKTVTKDLSKIMGKHLFLQGHMSEDGNTLFLTDAAYGAYQQNQAQAAEQRYREQLRQQAARERSKARPLTEQEQAMLAEGRTLLQQIDARTPDVRSDKVARQVQQIIAVAESIFTRAEQDPDTISDLQQMMDYYLPLTAKLLDTYADLAAQPIQSENIVTSRREIEDTLDTLVRAFAKLHNSLFRDITWDVSTDISVLNAVLAQDGLADDPFNKNAGGNHE